jgi:hypothetical protein
MLHISTNNGRVRVGLVFPIQSMRYLPGVTTIEVYRLLLFYRIAANPAYQFPINGVFPSYRSYRGGAELKCGALKISF